MPTRIGALDEQIRDWLRRLAACVAAVDYERATSELFAPDVVAFGTRAHIVTGVDAVREHQWSQVWPNVRDFRFELDSLEHGASGELVWAAALWSSTGFDAQGKPFERPGRATVLFRRDGERLLAVHTHFSLAPH